MHGDFLLIGELSGARFLVVNPGRDRLPHCGKPVMVLQACKGLAEGSLEQNIHQQYNFESEICKWSYKSIIHILGKGYREIKIERFFFLG